ncbi:hypothetical protein SYNPS1DRAFT_30604 [Syncephalis pseudoplumigaleata]|uniref:Uncharacterized protein n=1 Tax=Syncephalis pseudoplumigaleata TaxID=1712513 RepID=A0A4P9YUE2_9FUNG|nr:hypothetical protein SYNPS1DRAFT_30604 [Syncephalis pseudoplumigaleata]|eukprot:RKP23643.1 hypothetical protein SYNPS1DRAFT_30604 [Syncephalis pseudoplumigaleata]
MSIILVLLLLLLHMIIFIIIIIVITAPWNEPWEKTLSRLLNKHLHIEDTYPFTENPVPAKHPEAYHALSATTKQSYVRMLSQLDLLWLLCDWHLQKNKTIREKIDLNFRKPSSAMDKISMNVLSSMPVGYDKQQRSYWYFGDWPRVYRRAKRHPLQPYAYDAWEVVTTTLDELAGLIEVFRKEFLNTESELKNALQRLLDRATMVQRRAYAPMLTWMMAAPAKATGGEVTGARICPTAQQHTARDADADEAARRAI